MLGPMLRLLLRTERGHFRTCGGIVLDVRFRERSGRGVRAAKMSGDGQNRKSRFRDQICRPTNNRMTD